MGAEVERLRQLLLQEREHRLREEAELARLNALCVENRKRVLVMQARERPWLLDFMRGMASDERENFWTWVKDATLMSPEEAAEAARLAEAPVLPPGHAPGDGASPPAQPLAGRPGKGRERKRRERKEPEREEEGVRARPDQFIKDHCRKLQGVSPTACDGSIIVPCITGAEHHERCRCVGKSCHRCTWSSAWWRYCKDEANCNFQEVVFGSCQPYDARLCARCRWSFCGCRNLITCKNRKLALAKERAM